MLDKIMALVKDNAQDAVMNNSDIPENKKEDVIKEAASSIQESIKKETSSGGIQNILSSFTGGGGKSALDGIIGNASNTFIANLVSKLGLSKGVASKISAALIPLVMNKFFHKTADSNDSSFNIGSILSSFSGGEKDGGALGKIKGLFS